MNSQRVTFPGSKGFELAANLELPDFEPEAFVLFAHCFTCSRNVFAASRISKTLARRGLGVLRFDFTGLGDSEGDFANTDFSSNVEDLVHAAEYLRREWSAPRLLVGHSLGGAAVLAAAHEIQEVEAVATIAAPFEPAHVEALFSEQLDEIEADGAAEVDIGGRPFKVRKQFVEDLREQKSRERLARLDRALMVFHAPMDKIVGIENAREIFVAARHPKSFVSLDAADHLVSRREDAIYIADVLAAWSRRYISAGVDALKRKEENERVVHVREAEDGKYANLIEAGPHQFRSDEPESVGGADSGMTPYELLLAGLGACSSMTMRMYADHKGWPLESVEVELEHEKKSHGESKKKVDVISRRIKIHGDELDEEQRRKIFEIANRCPVHRTLEAEPVIENELVDAEIEIAGEVG